MTSKVFFVFATRTRAKALYYFSWKRVSRGSMRLNIISLFPLTQTLYMIIAFVIRNEKRPTKRYRIYQIYSIIIHQIYHQIKIIKTDSIFWSNTPARNLPHSLITTFHVTQIRIRFQTHFWTFSFFFSLNSFSHSRVFCHIYLVEL